MRNWFILFATTFTITTLILSLTVTLIPKMDGFDHTYVLHLAITSGLLSLYMKMMNKFPIESNVLHIGIDLTVIFTIVYITGYYIHLYPIHVYSLVFTLIQVIVIYSVITLIYHFILTKEAEQMNGKIKDWRNKHADSQTFE